MRAVVQRVTFSRVTVSDTVSGTVRQGLNVLLGVSETDERKDCEYIAEKIANLRIFEDEAGKMNLSLLDLCRAGQDCGVLLVSQFTLYGDCRKGRRPSFITAAGPEKAETLYEAVKRLLQEAGLHVETGVFRTHMTVEIVNDGPVTLLLDSEKQF